MFIILDYGGFDEMLFSSNSVVEIVTIIGMLSQILDARKLFNKLDFYCKI